MRNTFLHTTSFKAAKCLKALGIVVLLSFASFRLQAQTTASREYQVKAVFLFNFSQFVDWPPATFSSSNTPFVIGILGDDPFGSYIDETVAGEKMKGHPMVVHRYRTVKDITDCQILFIADPDYADEALRTLGRRSVLTVSDAANFARQGGMVRFFTENNKLRLQINPSAAKAAGLTISSKLLRLAEIVD